MSWFERLTGFRERSPADVRSQLELDGTRLRSRVNGVAWQCGVLETPTLAELRARVRAEVRAVGRPVLHEVIADVQRLHADAGHAGALFQVASQFNLLEMVGPHVTPEHGVAIYEHDRTQGPACAIAAGAGTIYRNYFVPIGGEPGQTAGRQLDCLGDLGAALGNGGSRLWRMENGYALPTAEGLAEVSRRLDAASEDERDRLRGQLRIGLQWDTEVTLPGAGHRVTQAHCAALPIAYARLPLDHWRSFATLVLEAAYEATLAAAALNAARGASRQVFLTLLGGGAFGNPDDWILTALERALERHHEHALEIAIVSYGR